MYVVNSGSATISVISSKNYNVARLAALLFECSITLILDYATSRGEAK
jgi:hypothetical protein